MATDTKWMLISFATLLVALGGVVALRVLQRHDRGAVGRWQTANEAPTPRQDAPVRPNESMARPSAPTQVKDVPRYSKRGARSDVSHMAAVGSDLQPVPRM